jgi:hypothetical protein
MKCLKCLDGFYPDINNNQCLKCGTNCLKCALLDKSNNKVVETIYEDQNKFINEFYER